MKPILYPLIFSKKAESAMAKINLGKPERPERGGPCWLLKLRWMGTQRVQMIGVNSWWVRWADRAGTRDFYSAVTVLVSPEQNIFLLTVHYTNLCLPIAQQPG